MAEPSDMSTNAGEARRRILWAVTGSVATIKADLLAEALLRLGEVRLLATPRAEHFLPDLPAEVERFRDEDEWSLWREKGDPVLHIELRKWADLYIIAPLTADGLANLATGRCPNLPLSVARAWDWTKPLLVAPAMNTLMWTHPVTRPQLETIARWGVSIIEPIEKRLACQDVGVGAMAEPEAVARVVAETLDRSSNQGPAAEDRHVR